MNKQKCQTQLSLGAHCYLQTYLSSGGISLYLLSELSSFSGPFACTEGNGQISSGVRISVQCGGLSKGTGGRQLGFKPRHQH